MAFSAHKDPEMMIEHEEDEASLDKKAQELAQWIKESKHFIAFTGAGVSTSAGIPDFRGPEGVWTLAATGGKRTKPTTNMLKALPSPTHMAIVALMNHGYLKFLISQNVDGIHRKSGIPTQNIAELHGNTNLEICKLCHKQYLRDYSTSSHLPDHFTGRVCSMPGCNGKLYDSIINFGENLPERDLTLGYEHSDKADLCLVLGSSLTVVPASDMPKNVSKHGKLVIVNLQKTPHDSKAALRVFAKSDEFMNRVMKQLGIQIPQFVLERRLQAINTIDEKTKEHTIIFQGIDVDGTPATFLKKIKVITHDDDRTMLRKEPFVYNYKPKKEQDYMLNVKLTFMGHYSEPELDFEHVVSKANSTKEYQLIYNPFERTWQSSSKDVPMIDISNLSLEEKKAQVDVNNNSSTTPNKQNPTIDMSNMFVVEPIDNCPHLDQFFKQDKIPIGMLGGGIMGLPCKSCGDTNENWICLECFQIGCSRYVKSHQEAHYKSTGHCIAASFSDLSVWCYGCESYIRDYSLKPFLKMLSDIKFGNSNEPMVLNLRGQSVLVKRDL